MLGATIGIPRYFQEAVMAQDNGGNSFMWFVAGLGLGALLGVLYAPRSGEETRESLRLKAEEGRDYLATRGRQARQQAEQWAERGREAVSRQKEQLSAAVEAGKQAYRESVTEGASKKSS
jgi:gas vesicle protein